MYAEQTAGPLSVLNGFIGTISEVLIGICMICGLAFILAGLYQWNERRHNPTLSMSAPVTFVLLGICLLLVQYLPMSTVGV